MEKKIFKKVIAIILTVMMMFSVVAVSASALDVSLSAGMSALQAQWSRGKGPSAGGHAIDYSYYSPIDGSDDTTKYPIVVLTAGRTEGEYEGKELTANDYAKWSASEYQARFVDAGGAFIIIARAPEEKVLYWNSDVLYPGLKAALDDFISAHKKNVDTTRIYMGGWCWGGEAVWKMAAAYPNFFAAIFPMSAMYAPSSSEISKLSNMPVWMICCKKDSLALYSIYGSPVWNDLKAVSKDKEQIRLTTYDEFYSPGDTNHNTWYSGSVDMWGPWLGTGMKTVDGNGNTVTVTESIGMIDWLSRQHSNYQGVKCNCNCHTTNAFAKFFFNLTNFFHKLFKMEQYRYCDCGISHW